jgi:acyl carrier protein
LSSVVFDQIRTMASDIFGVPVQRLSAESSPETIETWDSILHLNLVLALEERFGLQMSPEEIEQMKNIGETSKLIETKLQAAPR